MMHIGDRNPKT